MKYLVNRKEMFLLERSKEEGYSFEELTHIIAKKDDVVMEHINLLKKLDLVDIYDVSGNGKTMVKSTAWGIYIFNSLREWLLRVLT